MKKHWKFLVALFLVLLVGYLSFSHEDRMWDKAATFTDTIPDPITQDTSEAKPAWTSPTHDISRGDWKFGITYHTDSDNNYAVVYSMREMEDNATAGSRGKKLANIPLTQDSSTAECSLHFSEGITDICIEVYHVDGNFSLEKVTFTDTTRYTDKYFGCLFLAILVILIYYFNVIDNKDSDRHRRLIFDILLLTAVYSSVPLMNNYLADSQDLAFHISRIEGIVTSLENGHFPMWISFSGHWYNGYANPVMYPQIFLYIPAGLICLGMSPMNAYKTFLVLINFAGVFIAYYSFKNLFKSRSLGVLSSIAYNLCLYHLIDTYTRGALGEMLATVFLPLVFYGMYEVCIKDEKKWNVLAIGLIGILSSHILTTVMTAGFIALYFVILIPKMVHHHFLKRIIAMVKAGITTVLLNLYFLIPFLQFNRHEEFRVFSRGGDISGSACYLSQMFSVFVSADNTRYNVSLGSTKGEMAISIGWLFPLCCILFILLVFFGSRKLDSQRNPKATASVLLGKYALLGAVISLYLSSDLFPWDRIMSIPVLNILCGMQYPWRFLMMAQLFCTVVLCCLVQLLVCVRPEKKWILLGVAAVLCFACSVYYIDSTSEEKTIADRSLTGIAATDDLYRYNVADENGVADHYYYLGVFSSVDQTKIEHLQRNDTTLTFHYSLPEEETEAVLSVPVYAYPGYSVFIDNKSVSYEIDDWGMMRITTADAEADVVIEYTGFQIWKIAYIISIATVICIMMMALYRRAKILHRRRQLMASQ